MWLKLGLRSLRRSSSFAVIALAILTLGIGATTAMFSVTRTVLLKPLPYRDPGQLVTILFRVPSFSKTLTTVPVNAQHYQLWRDQSRTLQEIAMIGQSSAIVAGAGDPKQVKGAAISANFFHLLGVEPSLGRGFAAGEDQAGRDQVVVISNDFWRHELGSNPNAIGRKLLLDGKPYQIIGVTGAGFLFPRGAELSEVTQLPDHCQYWVPLVFSQHDLGSPVMNMDYLAIARLKPGVTIAQASADLTALQRVINKRFPEPIVFEPIVHSLQQLLSREARLPVLILMAAVAAVMLIVCINIMNLMMVKAAAQQREWAIQLAMGARSRDLMGAAFTEGLLLSAPASILGSLLAAWLLQLVRLKAPAGLPRIDDLSMDGAALLFALGISIITALLFSIWPAWRSAKVDPQEALQSSSRSMSEGRKGHFAGKLLVGVEVALSTVLLLTTSLLLRSFVSLQNVDPGITVQNLLTARIHLPPDKYHARADVDGFYKRLLAQVSALPSVQAAGTVSTLPLMPEDNNNPVSAGDRAAPPVAQWPVVHTHAASASYFSAAGIRIKEGHTFEGRADNLNPVVISENLAAQLWPGQNPIGRPLRNYTTKGMATVVGVVGTVHASSLSETPGNMIYFPDWLWDSRNMTLVVRTGVQPENLSAIVRAAIHQVDSQAAVEPMQAMGTIVADSLSARRFQLNLLAAFALVGLILTSLGVYGVLAFTTARRTGEIGVRMALGARPNQILSATLRQGMGPVLFGIAAGLAGSAALSRLLNSLLFQVQALDTLVYFATAVILLLVAVLACLIPARRAARLNPMEALHR